MTKYFRNMEVIGWVVIKACTSDELSNKLNDLMDNYEIVDCQYSTTDTMQNVYYSALVLLAVKKMLDINNKNLKTRKIIPINVIQKINIKILKQMYGKIGLCHGAFDLLHIGHIQHLKQAREMCDTLFVSITSNKFVAKRKGISRPIFDEQIRAYMVASLECVNYVVINDCANAVPLLKLLQPDIYIKGSDYHNKNTTGITAEKNASEKTNFTDTKPFSTTEIIKYLRGE